VFLESNYGQSGARLRAFMPPCFDLT